MPSWLSELQFPDNLRLDQQEGWELFHLLSVSNRRVYSGGGVNSVGYDDSIFHHKKKSLSAITAAGIRGDGLIRFWKVRF